MNRKELNVWSLLIWLRRWLIATTNGFLAVSWGQISLRLERWKIWELGAKRKCNTNKEMQTGQAKTCSENSNNAPKPWKDIKIEFSQWTAYRGIILAMISHIQGIYIVVGYEIDQYLTQLQLYGMWVVTMIKKDFYPPLSYFNSKGGNLFKREKVSF